MTPKQFIKQNEGVALIEFAIVLPLLLTLFLGMVEVANYTLQNQKLDKVANSMADFVTQGASVSKSNLDGFGVAVPQIMRPYKFEGTVIFTSATYTTKAVGACRANSVCIPWQYKILGSESSKVGSVGGAPTLPGRYPLQKNQDVIVAEAFLHYKPILSITSNFIAAFQAQTLYKAALLKPRQGTLTTLNP